jgi:hypothetical protein
VPIVEFAVPKRWRRHMMAISDIEDLLQGLVKLTWLKKFDQFGVNESVRAATEIPWS